MKRILISLSAGIAMLCAAALLRADTIYVAEEQLLRVSIVQSNGTCTPFADGVGLVYGLALDSQGQLYAAGAGNDTIYRVGPAGGVTVYATDITLGSPSALAFDGADNLFTSGYGWSGTVNRIAPDGAITRLVTGIGGSGLVFDPAGNLYVADRSQVIKLAPDGTATTISSQFLFTWGLACDRSGNLFVADNWANTITRIAPDGTASLFASGLNGPTGLAFDSQGDLYVCNLPQNWQFGYLSRITPDGTVSTVATGLCYPTAIAILAEPVASTNQPPIAQCTNVTVSAGDDGLAPACVDNGSFDPDGDPITVIQTPPGPYPLGTNQVLLTVIDDKGGSDSCSGIVTVLDTTAPVIYYTAARPAVLWPPNHQMVPVFVGAMVADNCGSASWKIVGVQCNEPVRGRGSGRTAPDWVITGEHTLQLRAERLGNGSDRLYTITLQATDPSGNRSLPATLTVRVPKDRSRSR